MSSLKVLIRISSFGIVCGGFNFYHPKLKCETNKKYHAWNETWKRHRENKTIPPWDPGTNTTATKFLDIVPINTNNIKILVPLCGSSHDMDYIQRYYHHHYNNTNTKIIGIEMSEHGIKSFLERVMENDDEYWIEYDNDIPIYRYDNYYLLESDIFNESLQKMALLQNINLIYDKESLSALPPSKWNIYIKFCQQILDKNGHILLTTWRYDVNQREIEQRYTSPYSFGYEDINDANKLFNSILNRECESKLIFTEKWNEAEGSNYYKFKSKCLGIDYKNAFCDIWTISICS